MSRLVETSPLRLAGWSAVAALGIVCIRFAIAGVPLASIASGIAAVALAATLRAARRLRTRGEPDLDAESARAMLAAFPEAVLVIRDGVVVAVNRRLCRLLDLRREELVGNAAPFRFWPPEHRHEHEDWHRRLAELGTLEGELTIRARDGRRIAALASGSVVPAGPGRSPATFVSLRDITARREVEDRLVALASRDPLTALLNEWGFQERLSEEVARARSAGRGLSVALIHFDGLNEPEDLTTVVQRFRADLRAGEQISRTSDAELAWILPETDAEGAVSAVERARGHLSRARGQGFERLRISAGVCDLVAASDDATLYAFAHEALRAARRQGGGTHVYGAPRPAGDRDQSVAPRQ